MAIAEYARIFFALLFVLGLIGAAAWGLRRFGPEWLVQVQRTKTERRLAIVESLTLDPARRLVLVRLDGAERLLLLGEGRLIAETPALAKRAEPAA